MVDKFAKERDQEYQQVNKLQQETEQLRRMAAKAKNARLACVLQKAVQECDNFDCKAECKGPDETKLTNEELSAKCEALEEQLTNATTTSDARATELYEHCDLLQTQLTMAAEKGLEALQEAQEWRARHDTMQQAL